MSRQAYSPGAVTRDQDAATRLHYNVSSSESSEVAQFGQHAYPLQEQFAVQSQTITAGLFHSEQAWASEPAPSQHLDAHLRQFPSCGTGDSYSSSNTDCPQSGTAYWGTVDPAIIHEESHLQYQYPMLLPSIPQATSPSQLSSPFSSPTSFLYQSDSPAQETEYATGQGPNYFDLNSGCSQYPVRQEQHQPPNSLQRKVFCPNPDISDFLISLPPGQPVHHDEEQDTAADCSSPGPNVCVSCNVKFKRQTDFERHLKTSRAHVDPRGPACPERDCKVQDKKFTRRDNFKVHYMNHGKSSAEADAFIREWRAKGNL